jgi:hypothetical protein
VLYSASRTVKGRQCMAEQKKDLNIGLLAHV